MLKLEDLTQTAIERAIQDFYKAVSTHVAGAVMIIARDRYSIPREPRRLGNAQFDYYFAADLDLLFRYALGGVEASGTLIENLIETIVDLLEIAPSGGRAPTDWTQFGDTALGGAIAAARARVKLRRQSDPLTSEEICLLSGWNSQKLAAAKIPKAGKGQYQADGVKAAFDKEGLRC